MIWLQLAGFAGIILIVTAIGRILGRRGGFVRGPIAAIAGMSPIATSGWGGGRFGDAVQYSGCLRLHRYGNGYLFEVAALFGGGERWLPDAAVRSVVHFPARVPLLFPARVELATDLGMVIAYGACEQLIATHPPNGASACAEVLH